MIRLMKSAAGELFVAGQNPGGRLDFRTSLVEASHPVVGIEGLDLVLPEGTLLRSRAAPLARLRFHDWRAVAALMVRDQAGLFEAYLDGQFDLESDEADQAGALLGAIQAFDEQSSDYRWLMASLYSSRHWWQQNTPFRRTALRAHYSAPPAFWLSFLSNRYPIYSHYLFEEHEGHEHWAAACERKLAFALSSCKLKPGDRVLNVGEGWGGFMTYAGSRGLLTTSITLNEQSYEACLAKRQQEGLEQKCQLVRGDFYHYRSSERFDAITNMGVTEHLTDYDALMANYARHLKPGGHVYCDFVGTTFDAPFRSLIQKYVYPGAAAVYLPRLMGAAERSGTMDVVATYDDRLSYDKTCVAWARNVEAQRDYIVGTYGEKRYRWIWSYLWMCVYGFRTFKNGITGTRVVLRRR
jgi:cyclopropane-fatty-acyl-phospholipid synthase